MIFIAISKKVKYGSGIRKILNFLFIRHIGTIPLVPFSKISKISDIHA